MKKEELLNKLSKKDKEEYLEKEKKIYIEPMRLWVTYIKWTVLYFLFLLIVLPLWYIAFADSNPQTVFSITIGLFGILKVLFYVIIFGVIIDYLIFIANSFKRNKLKKEYFEVVPKKR